ncbi:tetratricopeptide repeat protein [Amycolatopsis sp. NPDC004169]|uniref:ATP-binding protein n=1 Tax=Amycolatopsis sp. NPDC004169 TaxID=3154453 RepID=UPI0033B51C97
MSQTKGSTDNAVTGSAEQIVQAGSVSGDIHVHAASSASLPRPRQLPPEVTHFTGREAELGELDALLSEPSAQPPSAVVVSAIAGAAGIGKSSLAVHWAHLAEARFPDGQLFTNLHGYDAGPPLTAAQVLDSFLRALGLRGEQIPRDLDAMAGTYRSLLAGRRMLIVLDNAATPEQVRPLLPNNPACLVLVTSRSRLSGLVARDGAYRITLDVLAPMEAHSLVRDIVGHDRADREPPAVAELAQRCARLPLALRIAAERVASRSELTLDDVVRDLDLAENRLDMLAADDDEAAAVRAVFSWSYRTLTAKTARMFRLLGLHPGPSISVAAAAALDGSTTAEAKRQLETLAGVHLLAPAGRDRYQFHDLLRAYATELATTDEPERQRYEATRRLFEWYLHSAHAGLFVLFPQHPEIPVEPLKPDCVPLTFADADASVRWFTAEHANLMAIIRHAPEAGQHVVGWQLPNAFDCFLGDSHFLADQIAVHQLGLAAAQHLGDQLGECWAYGHLGEAYEAAQQYSEAISCYEKQLAIAVETGNLFSQGCALGDLSNTHIELRRFEEAADCARRALRIYRSIGHRRNEAVTSVSLGKALHGLRQSDEALLHAHHGLAILEEIRAGRGWALRGIGMIHAELRQDEQAIDYLQRAVAAYREGPLSQVAHGETLVDLGSVLHRLGRVAEARDSWQEAVELLADLAPAQAADVRALLLALDTTDQEIPPSSRP